MSSLFRFRTFACVTIVMLPACVIRLADRNSPLENGGVSGEAADCSRPPPEGEGGFGGELAPKYVGRFLYGKPPEATFDWSGNYITARVEGTKLVTVKLRLPGPEEDEVVQDQMFTFVVDGVPQTRRITVRKEAPSEPEEDYEIDESHGLSPNEPHEITIYKNTEAQKGPIMFKGFDLHGGSFLPPTRRVRRMEFIGDSIICAYGNEGKNATCPFEVKVRDAKDAQGNPVNGPDGKPMTVTVPLTENQYLSFTSIAARELAADAVTICWSGRGVYKNYKERTVVDPVTKERTLEDDTLTTVPQLWERTIERDFKGEVRKIPWDFAQEKDDERPQVVFISLGTNDFSRDTKEQHDDPSKLSGDGDPDGDMNSAAEREEFFKAYLRLVRNVRLRRPEAHIFLATPPMVTDQYPLDNARSNIRETLRLIVESLEHPKDGGPPDKKVYRMDLVEQGFRYGLGCDYHPNLEVHRIMAKQLVGAVRSKTCW